MKAMEIDGMDYFVKPCPICGRMEFLKVSPRKQFEELLKENGSATISILCTECYIEMFEHDYSGDDYHKKVSILIRKWNERK